MCNCECASVCVRLCVYLFGNELQSNLSKRAKNTSRNKQCSTVLKVPYRKHSLGNGRDLFRGAIA